MTEDHTLKGKHILFLSASFFGYNKDICDSLKKRGAIVDYFDERPANSFMVKALIRLRPELLTKYINRYHNDIIEQTRHTRYDYIFFIKAESITVDSLEKLKHYQCSAKFLLYLWDSFDNFKNASKKLPFFDKVLSFDKSDCHKYGLEFRPLFYLNQYASISRSSTQPIFDILFIGTVHSDRYLFLDQVKRQIEQAGKKSYFFLFFMSRVLFYKQRYWNKSIGKTNLSDFHFNSLSKDQILHLVDQTVAVLDIQHPHQSGLTMRTIETLGASKKLITTNVTIESYDFYNSNNILIVDRQNPIIDLDFFSLPYKELPASTYNYYSIDSWIDTIFR